MADPPWVDSVVVPRKNLQPGCGRLHRMADLMETFLATILAKSNCLLQPAPSIPTSPIKRIPLDKETIVTSIITEILENLFGFTTPPLQRGQGGFLGSLFRRLSGYLFARASTVEREVLRL